MEPLYLDRMPSPVGPLHLVATDAALVGVHFEDPGHDDRPATPAAAAILAAARAQLDAYFAGTLRAFDLPLAPQGTPFQCDVWAALARLAYGATTSYGALAASIHRPRAVRAVGGANGRNPLAIILPCHRVIGADGSLTGYGGGEARKRWLLHHEQQNLRDRIYL